MIEYSNFQNAIEQCMKNSKFRISRDINLADGSTASLVASTPLTMPNHDRIKGSTLRIICRQSGISRDEFLKTYERV